jgi:hypothetical protein
MLALDRRDRPARPAGDPPTDGPRSAARLAYEGEHRVRLPKGEVLHALRGNPLCVDPRHHSPIPAGLRHRSSTRRQPEQTAEPRQKEAPKADRRDAGVSEMTSAELWTGGTERRVTLRDVEGVTRHRRRDALDPATRIISAI